MKTLLIMNPGSRAGRGQRRWQAWTDQLRECGVEFDAVTTTAPGHAVELARAARSYHTVVAIGGDGTINEVLDGLVQAGNPAQRMGVLYAGTSPDFCRFQAIPVEPAAALATLLRGHSRQVDVAEITYRDRNGRICMAHFGCSCNIGLGAAIAAVANRLRPWLGDLAGTAVAALYALSVGRPVELAVGADGVQLTMAPVNNLSILKNPYLASGLHARSAARPDDGRLQLLGIHGKNRSGLLRLLPAFYTGQAATHPHLLCRPASRVTVTATQPWPIEFDGDPRGFLPVEIRIKPGALRLVCDSDNPAA